MSFAAKRVRIHLLASLLPIASCLVSFAGDAPETLRLPPRLGLAGLSSATSIDAALEAPARNRLLVCGDANRRFTPCSTFKIPSALIGLRLGVLKGKETRLGGDGAMHEMKEWNGDLTMEEAFRVACVPYVQKLMSRLRKDDVLRELKTMNYGDCDLSAWNETGHNTFWLESTLKISPLEQVRFLQALFDAGGNARSKEAAVLRDVMTLGRRGDVEVFGKTGTGRNYDTNRLEGWFVGFLRFPDGTVGFLAIHGATPEEDMTGIRIRDEILPELLKNGLLERSIPIGAPAS